MRYLLIILLLTSCATATQPVTGTVPLSRELAIILPKFNELGQNIEVRQLVTARYKDQVFTFEGYIIADKNHFTMTGLDSFGRRAITITWTKDGIKYDAAPFVPPQLKPENILADMVIMYWPENSVRKALGANGKLVASKNKRSVYVGDKEVIHAEYQTLDNDLWDGPAVYKNLEWGYQLDIQSTDSE